MMIEIPGIWPCYLLTSQPIREREHILQTSPQVFPIKTSLKTTGEFGLFEPDLASLLVWSCNKPFPAPNSDALVYLGLPCFRHVNLGSTILSSSLLKCKPQWFLIQLLIHGPEKNGEKSELLNTHSRTRSQVPFLQSIEGTFLTLLCFCW